MKSNNQFIIIVTAITLFSFYGCGKKEEQKQSNAPQQMPVITISSRDFTGTQEFNATVEGIQNIEIRAKVAGYIKEIYVDEGQNVQEGDLLFKLETATLSQEAESAKAQIASAEAKVEAAQIEKDRIEALVKKEIVSDVQLQNAIADLNAAKAQLNNAKSNLKNIQANIDYTRIVSPIDGIVGKINLRNGSLVGPNTATPLTVISNNKKVYAYFSMNESDYIDLFSDTTVKSLEARIDAFPNVQFRMSNGKMFEHKGKIDAITGTIDPSTGAIRLRAIFENPASILLHGSTGEIIMTKDYEGAVGIPQLSTFNSQDKTMVYVLGEDNTLTAKSIQIKNTMKGIYVLESGLQEGDKILAKGANKIKPGSTIVPQPVSMDSILNSYTTTFK